MGFLAPVGAAIGSIGAAGAGTAAGAAGSSLGFGALATGLSAGGSLLQGIGGLQQGLFAAKIARENARAALRAGQYAETTSKMKYGALEAEQKVGAAASGVEANSGSAAKVQHSTEIIGALDAAMIHYNAAREAYGERVQAGLDTRAGIGALAAGALGAGTSFLSGASSLSDKWLAYKRSGAIAGG